MPTNQMPAWSYSMLDCFETCPRMFFHRYILKEKEPKSAQQLRGQEVHNALENRVKGDIPLPADMAAYEPMAASVARMKDGKQLYTELKMGMDKSLQPAKFFAQDVWGRCAADVAIINRKEAGQPLVGWVGDWKDGKVREKPLQLAITALFMFKMFPGLDRIIACNIWLNHGKIGTPYRFDRAQEPAMWAELMPRLQKIEQYVKNAYYPETPSPLCGWCQVKACQFNQS